MGSPSTGPARAALASLIDGYLATQLLYVSVRLGIPERLRDGPRAGAEIAAAVSIPVLATGRVLNGLAALGVLDGDDEGRFALTPMGRLLLDGEPGSLRGATLARGALYYRAGEELLASLTEGGVPFERATGEGFFEYLDRDERLAASFQASMADRSRQEAAAVVDAVEFDRYATVVDVGGGTGILLEAILSAHSHLHGTLFDLPAVAAIGDEMLSRSAVGDRCRVVGGDFFTDPLPAGDVLMLSCVLHDWDDDSAVAILRRCRDALAPGGVLRIVEAILPDRPGENLAVTMMDLHMLLLFRDARERTAAGYGALLDRAGLRLDRVVPTGSPAGIAVIEAVPA